MSAKSTDSRIPAQADRRGRGRVSPRPFLRETAGLLALGTTVFLAAAFFSFSPDDPTLSRYDPEGSTNWMGPVGAHIAYFFKTFVGASSWWLPVISALLAVNVFRPRKDVLPPARWAIPGFAAAIAATSTLLSLMAGLVGGSEGIGGTVGIVMNHSLSRWFGIPGAALFALLLLLSGLLAATPFSLSSLCHSVTRIRPGRAKGGISSPAKEAASPSPAPEPEEIDTPLIKEHKRSPEASSLAGGKGTSPDAFEVRPVSGEFALPPLGFLQEPPPEPLVTDKDTYILNARTLEQKLLDFGVAGKVVEICPGPVVTMYEFAPAPGVKINKVASLSDDLALALKSRSVRIVAPIPGKGVIGIELANAHRETVFLKEVLASKAFRDHGGRLPLALGQDIVGNPAVTDLSRMPHLLIAGATGTGKSVGLNAMICSLLYRHRPRDLRLLMIDPKRIELSLYDGIPHLLHPVVSEPKEATRALRWAVLEMERRYQLLEEAHVRNLEGYNKDAEEVMPYLVVIIDELADLMMVSSKEVESAIARLAQMARAAGIHLLVATQRPSVDVLTGLIKANFPARISFKVSSKVDSRTILDTVGAEQLLGMGDMLFLPPGSSVLERIHGAFVTEKEITRIVEFLKAQDEPRYDSTVTEALPGEDEPGTGQDGGPSTQADERYDEAVEIVTQTGQASISMVQRRLRVGYNRAARMIEQMEKDGIVSPMDAKGRREVLVRGYGRTE